jgi:hypothetical protein
LAATERQQQMAMQVEAQASSLEMGGAAQALQTEAAAGDPTAGILAAVGSAVGTYGSAQSAKADTKAAGDLNFQRQAALQTLGDDDFRDPNGKLDMDAFNNWFNNFNQPTE